MYLPFSHCSNGILNLIVLLHLLTQNNLVFTEVQNNIPLNFFSASNLPNLTKPILQNYLILASSSATMVEHLSQHPKVNGSSLATATGIRVQKMTISSCNFSKIKMLTLHTLKKFYFHNLNLLLVIKRLLKEKISIL